MGKTTATAAWLRSARAAGVSVVGWKAIETGGDDDQRLLGEACGVHIPARYQNPRPVSPHLEARGVGQRIEAAALWERLSALVAEHGNVIVELAGGAFSPLDDDGMTNADLLAALRVDRTVLVAANRLGVLHDVEACRRAGLAFHALLLTRGHATDESVETNATELARRSSVPIIDADFCRPVPALRSLDAWFQG